MSLLWIDGFEGYGTSVGSYIEPTGIIERRYNVGGADDYIRITAGRVGGYGIYTPSSSIDCLDTPAINSNSTIIVGLAIKRTSNEDDTTILSLVDDTTYGMNVRWLSSGEFCVRRGTTVLATTSGLNLLQDVWYWVEFKVLVDNSSGTYELKVGAATVLSDTGVDTQIATNNYYDKVRLYYGNPGTYHYYDDLYVCNGAGSLNNDFLGNVKVTAIFPDADGNSSDFTPSAGDNYTCVDEEVVNDDTDYVESDTSSHKDLYSYESCGSPASILGLQINTDCRETDATSYSIHTVIRSGEMDYDDSSQSLGTTNYVTKMRVSEIDPNTSSAWTPNGVDNAEFGIKVA